MLLRHETTPGYAKLHRRQRRRHRVSGQVATGVIGALLLVGFVVALVTEPAPQSLFALGAAVLLYALASFGLEQTPRASRRPGGSKTAPMRRTRAAR